MNGCEYLGTLRAKVKSPWQIFSRHREDHKTVPVIYGKTLWRSRKLREVSPRPSIPGPATRVLTATFVFFAPRDGLSVKDKCSQWVTKCPGFPRRVRRCNHASADRAGLHMGIRITMMPLAPMRSSFWLHGPKGRSKAGTKRQEMIPRPFRRS